MNPNWLNIPAELRALNQWVVCYDDKKPRVPLTGALADTTDRSTWGTFEQACNAGFPHIGFVFTPDDPYTCADLDDPTTVKVRGEEIPNPNEAEVERLKALHAHISAGFDSYSEVSTRGRGEHIVIEGKLPANVQRDKVELYSVNHFVIMTGNVLNNSPIRNYQMQLSNMASQMVSSANIAELEELDATESDDVILERARKAKNAKKFNSLWSGNQEGFPSQSEADMALFEMLCFYSKSNEQCRRLFRLSALGQRDKATKNNVYLDRTLAKVRGRQQAEAVPLVDFSALLARCSAPPVVIPPPPPPQNGASSPKDKTASHNDTDYFAPLDARRIDLSNPPPKPIPVFTLLGQQICTPANLTGISAQPKGGKSASVGALLASIIVAGTETQSVDCLGFAALPHNGRAVILFDTEQSPHDSHMLVQRAAVRAGVTELPSNFRLYRLLDMPTKMRREYLAKEMKRASDECGGIHSVIIDGVADLCVDPNDSMESFGLVEEHVQLAVKHECPIIGVIHENPAQQNGAAKTRGHLGSQLERKAESNLRLVKENDVCVIYSEKCRSASIPKGSGVHFAWSDAAGMHVTVHNLGGEPKQAKKLVEQRLVCDAVFAGVSKPFQYHELVQSITRTTGTTKRTAEKRIPSWIELGLIKKDEAGYIQL